MITLRPDRAWAEVLRSGQRLAIRSRQPVHFVAFNHADLRERFDDARTRGNPGKLYLTTGDFLLSKSNRKLLSIAADGHAPGTHDLETGICLCCRAPMARALEPWGIRAPEVPSAFNLFMTVAVDGGTGALVRAENLAPQPALVELRAEMDCLVGVGACADAKIDEPVVELAVLT